MRIPGVTTLVLLLATTVVTAAPAREETTGRVSYNDRAPRPSPAADPDASGWLELASATPASHGREFIVVGAETGALTHLRLSAASGRPGIQAVRVDYVGGGQKTFAVDKVLGARRGPAYVDLRGPREIRQIVVISDRDSRGSYRLEGRAGATGVALR